MSQSKRGSIVEITCNTLSGIMIATITAEILFPLYGVQLPSASILSMNLVFTVISIIRGYVWRRVFVKYFRG